MKQTLAFLSGAILASVGVFLVMSRDQVAPPEPPAPPPVVEELAVPTPPQEPVAEVPVKSKPKPRVFQPPVPVRITTSAPVSLPAPPSVVLALASTPPPLARAVFARPDPPPPEPNRVTITPGTMLTVRLAQDLSSELNAVGDSFSATIDQPVIIDEFVIVERGARALGRVVAVERAGRVKGTALLVLELSSIDTSDGQTVPIATTRFERKSDSDKGRDVAKVGAATSIGAAIGAIAGGGKGAAIGAAIGGAASTGGVLATRGRPATLETETRIFFRLDEPVTIIEKI